MKKLFLILMLISSEGWADCVKISGPSKDVDTYRCIYQDNEVCYYSRVYYGYSVSCFHKPKSK